MKTKEITIPAEYSRKYRYGSVTGCPLYHTLEDNGYPVFLVGGDSWTTSKGHMYRIINSDELAAWAVMPQDEDFTATVEVP